ncbi:GntR family transcriptional regulator [Rhodoligotrophos ferricapiens]|uniref:GntR family transcriptional regulator n=1 Tax=Rhodoligotrophos ferricapiens TaxID=3069264 RepID=UPI00315D2F74
MREMEAIELDQRRGETVDLVVDYLRRGILAGEFAPGQRLISREIIEQIGVSRGPLREAFRRLAAEGLIELTTNRGASVRRFSRDEIAEIFEIREMLEGLAAQLAAKKIDLRDNRRRFEEIWAPQASRKFTSSQEFIEANRLLHRVIMEISGNAQLSKLIDQMALPVVMFQLRRLMSPEDVTKSMQEHIAIAEAILAGDGQRAEDAMRTHLRSSAARFMKMPATAFRPGGEQ